jgi:hypothetical protein
VGFGVSVRRAPKGDAAEGATLVTTNGTQMILTVPGSRFKRFVKGPTDDCPAPRTVLVLSKEASAADTPWYQQPWIILVFAVGFFWVRVMTSWRSSSQKIETTRRVDEAVHQATESIEKKKTK